MSVLYVESFANAVAPHGIFSRTFDCIICRALFPQPLSPADALFSVCRRRPAAYLRARISEFQARKADSYTLPGRRRGRAPYHAQFCGTGDSHEYRRASLSAIGRSHVLLRKALHNVRRSTHQRSY